VKISSVSAVTVRVPLANPPAFSTRRVHAREYTLVRVRDEDGVEGIGFSPAGPGGGAIMTTAVRDLLAKVVVGEDPYRIEGLWQEMYQEALLHGRAGAVMRALSAVDVALWDHNARAVGLPLWRFLGAVHSETVPAYASGGYYLDGKGPDGLADEVRGYVDMGFQAVKIKVGRLSPPEEEQRVAAVREAVGPDVLVMLDANNAWPDLPTALQSVRRFEPYDPYWIEEPFSPDDIDNHARLARSTPVPVVTGEVEAGRWRHKELLEKEAAAILQTDVGVAGGITEFRRIAATAASYGVPMAPHAWHHLHVHVAASTPNCAFVEYFTDDSIVNIQQLVDTQWSLRDGRIVLPTSPGLGFSFLEDVVDEFSVDSWA
jgi:L-alanine-DL-glutamate epimerase-like enolase superfamily enzyme